MQQNEANTIDVTGMCCPLPLIHLAKTVQKFPLGQVFKITGNDPSFAPSVTDFCQSNGHEILETTHGENHNTTFLIKVGGRSG